MKLKLKRGNILLMKCKEDKKKKHRKSYLKKYKKIRRSKNQMNISRCKKKKEINKEKK